MNKNGVLGKILSTLPIFLLIVFIMGIFLILTGYTKITKAKDFFMPLSVQNIELDSVLLKGISVNGESVLLLDGFLRDCRYKNEARMLNEKIKSRNFYSAEEENAAKERIAEISGYERKLRDQIKNELERFSVGSSERYCFISFLHSGRPSLSEIVSSRDIYLIIKNGKSENGNVADLESYYDAGLLYETELLISSNFNGKEKEKFAILSYYGKCHSLSELEELISKRREK